MEVAVLAGAPQGSCQQLRIPLYLTLQSIIDFEEPEGWQ
jgi:hypothetical protein